MKHFKKHICALYFLLTAGVLFGSPNKEYEVLGLSSAIIDHFFFITDEQLKEFAIEKGGWAPIDYPTLSSILEQNQGVSKMVPGGSGANVIKVMQKLGHSCTVLGKIGSGEKGEYYAKRMKDQGIVPLLKKGALPTGQAVCLITPDGQRTFRTYLGASHSLSDLTIDPNLFEQARLFHIEGYQLIDPDLVIRTLEGAKKMGVTVSLDLANVEIVKRNKEFIRNILEEYVDILFCNKREAKELTGLPPAEACDKLSAFCEIAVVTMSERGSWARSASEKVFMEARSVHTIDTTGAGDLYASGFLHGYLKGEPLRRCTWIGALVASEVVRRIGAEIPDSIWEEIRIAISEDCL